MSRTFANLLLVLAAICWGMGNVAQQTVLEHIGPLMTTGLKSLIAAAVIMPFCLRASRSPHPLDRHGIDLAIVVTLSFVAATTLMQTAYGLTSVTNAGFLVNTATVITPIFAWVFLAQRPSNIIWFAALATFSGAVLMGGGHIGALSSGDLLALGSGICFAVWMVSLGAFVSHYGYAGEITIIQFCATALICTPAALALEANTASAILAALPQLLFIGVISTAGGYLLQAIAQRHTSAAEAAVIVSAEAVIGAVLAFILLGEQLNLERGFGAILIICSILLVQIPPKRLSRPAPKAITILTPGE
ncbi:MAG: DMT family transporter [Rhizobiaceae bacterium]